MVVGCSIGTAFASAIGKKLYIELITSSDTKNSYIGWKIYFKRKCGPHYWLDACDVVLRIFIAFLCNYEIIYGLGVIYAEHFHLGGKISLFTFQLYT